MASNANIGKLILCAAFSIFLYYFFWIAILPFMRVEEGKMKRILYSGKIFTFPIINYRQLDSSLVSIVGIRIYDTTDFWHIFRRFNYVFYNVPCEAIHFVCVICPCEVLFCILQSNIFHTTIFVLP